MMHETHDPKRFYYAPGWYCTACEICTCHSPDLAAEPCDANEAPQDVAP